MAIGSRNADWTRRRQKLASLAGIRRAIQDEFAFRRAIREALANRRAVVHGAEGSLAVIPLADLRRLEWFLEQEKEEEEQFDRIDVEEAERILADPDNETIPYEQVRRELGLGFVVQ